MICGATARCVPIAPIVTMQPDSDSIFSRRGMAVISLDFSSVATSPSTIRTSHPQADTLGRGERRTSPVALAVDGDHALHRRCEVVHEGRKTSAEHVRIEATEEQAERVVARHGLREIQESPEEGLLRPGECRHVGAVLPTRPDRAKRDDQKRQQSVPHVLAAAVFNFSEMLRDFQAASPRMTAQCGVVHSRRFCKDFQSAIPPDAEITDVVHFDRIVYFWIRRKILRKFQELTGDTRAPWRVDERWLCG
jgi:hypothetical protein